MPGLLIVNADDFGGNPLATDRIAACFAAERITSTTAMVYMEDSERAAAIARSRGLAVGLHLNVTQAFDDPATPQPVQDRQARLVRYFADRRLRRFTFNPVLERVAKRCLADQLVRFRELYGREPTHIDGHNHAHLSPTMLLALPSGARIRAGQSKGTGRQGISPASLRHALIARRHTTTDYFFAINRLGPSPTASDIAALLAPAERASLEIMVHPDRDYDYELLMSDAWKEGLDRRTIGSYQAFR